MTYRESYEQCRTYEELWEKASTDIVIAKQINPDRIDVVLKALYTVCKERGWLKEDKQCENLS